MQIFLTNTRGKRTSFIIEPQNNVSWLKCKAAEILHRDQDKMKLLFRGRLLENEKVLADCLLEEGAVVHYIAKMQIFVKNIESNKISFDVQPETTVAELKGQVAEKFNMKTKVVIQMGTLSLGQQHDEKSLEELIIHDGMCLDLIEHVHGGVSVHNDSMY